MNRIVHRLAAAAALLLAPFCADERASIPDEGSAAGCEAAFRQAADAENALPLAQTLAACDGIGEWVPAAASYPDLVPTQNEVRFAATICASAQAPSLVQSETCRQAFERYPGLRPQAPGGGGPKPGPTP